MRPGRWTPEEWAEARWALHLRSKGRCDRCGEGLRDRAEAHHRQMRSQQGQDDLDNLLWVHPECHRAIHAEPEAAYRMGWLVSREDEPEEVPWKRLR